VVYIHLHTQTSFIECIGHTLMSNRKRKNVSHSQLLTGIVNYWQNTGIIVAVQLIMAFSPKQALYKLLHKNIVG